MDPVSLSGLGLGATSLAIQLFDGLRKSYEYFEVAIQMPEQYASFRLRLQIEHTRLLDWGDAAGINNGEDAFNKKMKISLQCDTLIEAATQQDSRQLRKTTTETVDLKEYSAIFDTEYVPQGRRKYPKGFNHIIHVAGGIGHIGKQPVKTFRWVMKNEKRFRDDLQRMKQLTDYLHETLGDTQRNILMEIMRETCLVVLQLASDVKDMKSLLEMSKLVDYQKLVDGDDSRSDLSQAETLVQAPSLGDGSGRSSTAAHGSSVFERLAEFRAVNISSHETPRTGGHDAPVLEQKEDLLDMKDGYEGRRATATYKGHTVWIERKAYERERMATEDDVEDVLSDSIRADAEHLVFLLRAKSKPVEFCVPGCAGYFNDADNDRFGFVYEVRGPALGQLQLRSLVEVLKSRVDLAKRLSACLLYLHATNWLHKGLRSESIPFLGESNEDRTQPYISSFEYSRPDDINATVTGAPDSPEWAMYCHPNYINRVTRFRKTYDIYSLGIILIEIAYWKPAERIFDFIGIGEGEVLPQGETGSFRSPFEQLQERNFAKLSKTRQVRECLLRDKENGGRLEYMQYVRDTMGDKYCSTVNACIGGMEYFHLPTEADQTDPVIATLIQQAYLRLVVDVLDSIAI